MSCDVLTLSKSKRGGPRSRGSVGCGRMNVGCVLGGIIRCGRALLLKILTPVSKRLLLLYHGLGAPSYYTYDTYVPYCYIMVPVKCNRCIYIIVWSPKLGIYLKLQASPCHHSVERRLGWLWSRSARSTPAMYREYHIYVASKRPVGGCNLPGGWNRRLGSVCCDTGRFMRKVFGYCTAPQL